jgi:hypothetical protein
MLRNVVAVGLLAFAAGSWADAAEPGREVVVTVKGLT